MFSALLVKLCAPTLAGIKAANLFSYEYKSPEEAYELVAQHNKLLNPKGIYLHVLKIQSRTALIFVYRQSLLENILQSTDIQSFLQQYDYVDFDIPSALSVLEYHLLTSEFPHEIGIFLDYPLWDVKAFILHKGKYHKCVGCWKVYTNVEQAKNTFCLFDECTKQYCARYNEGTDILGLVAAG